EHYRRRFGSIAALGLWGILPAAVLATLLPAQRIVVWVERGAADAQLAAITAPLLPIEHGPSGTSALLVVWMLGASVMLGALVNRQLRFRRALGKLNAWRGCVRRSDLDHAGPVVLGPWRPFVVIPRDFESRF